MFGGQSRYLPMKFVYVVKQIWKEIWAAEKKQEWSCEAAGYREKTKGRRDVASIGFDTMR